MTVRLRGNTWDHTRGYDPMVATAERFVTARAADVDLIWERRSLQAFADLPVRELAAECDLMVIDHPHVGEAAQEGSLLAFDEIAPPKALNDLRKAAVGNSYDSYVVDGQVWALPLDAACQVSARREDLLATSPTTWDEVRELAEDGQVLWPLKPVDAICSFQTIAANRGTPCGLGDDFTGVNDGVAVLELMSSISSHLPERCLSMNPIETLDLMSTSDAHAYCPLLFGYTNYARPGYRGSVVHFGNVPSSGRGPIGSILGGAGLALSARSENVELAVEYALWVTSGQVQRTLYFDSGGQPAHEAAWDDDQTNSAANDFFRATRRTIDTSWIRPRHAGFIDFQDRAGDIVNAYLHDPNDPRGTVEAINRAYEATRT
jgi:multiple sugar transport system substrate-binding protein